MKLPMMHSGSIIYQREFVVKGTNMFLLPYERFTVITHMSRNEVLNSIRRSEEFRECYKSEFVDDFVPSKMKKGEKFKIVPHTYLKNFPALKYRNSFIPVITGVFLDEMEGKTQIKIVMRPYVLVSIFMLLWLSFPVINLWRMIFNGEAALSFRDSSVILLIFGLMLYIGGFKLEVPKRKGHLLELLEAEIVSK